MLRRLWSQVFRSRNRRDAVLIAAGAGLGQALTLVLSPVLSRLYSPEDFGAFSVYAGLIGMCSIVCTLRYEYALPLVERDREAGILFKTLALWTLLVSLLAGLLLWWIRRPLLARFDLLDYDTTFALVPFGMAAFALFQLSLYLTLRGKKFQHVAVSRATQGGAVGLAQAAFGALGQTTYGLAGGHAVSSGVGVVALAPLTLRSLGEAWQWSSARKILSRFRDFVRYSVPAALINVAAVRSPSFLLTIFSGGTIGGSFMFCQTLLSAPVMLFGRSVGQVYYAELATRLRSGKGSLAAYFLRLIATLAALAIVPAAVLMITAPALFSWLFGEQWVLAGQMAQVLALVFFVEAMIIPVTQTLEALQKQKLQLYWDTGRLLLIVTTIGLSLRMDANPLDTVRYYVATMILSYLALALMMYRQLCQREAQRGT